MTTPFLAEATDLSFTVIQRKCYGKEKIWNKMCVTENEKITKPLFQLASLFFSESELHTRYILILGCSSTFKKKTQKQMPTVIFYSRDQCDVLKFPKKIVSIVSSVFCYFISFLGLT